MEAGSKAKKLLERLCQEFLDALTRPWSTFTAIRIVVRGIAAMAPSIAYLKGKQGQGRMSASKSATNGTDSDSGGGLVMRVILALKRASDLSMEDQEGGSDAPTGILSLGIYRLNHAALFLHAIASVLLASPTENVVMSNDLAEHLQKTSVDLVVAFPRVSLLHQHVVTQGLCLLLQALYNLHASTFNAYLNELIPALFYRSLSRREMDERVNINMDFLAALTKSLKGTNYALRGDRLVTPYVAVWSELLVPADSETVEKVMIPHRYDQTVAVALYGCLMTEALRSLRTLDLVYIEVDGILFPVTRRALDSADMANVLSRIYGADALAKLAAGHDLDLSYEIKNEQQNAAGSDSSPTDQSQTDTQDDDGGSGYDGGQQTVGVESSTPTVFPNNPADQDVLLSLVTLLELLIPRHLVDHLPTWFSAFCDACVVLARNHPFVSPSYRMLRCLLETVTAVPKFTKKLQKIRQRQIADKMLQPMVINDDINHENSTDGGSGSKPRTSLSNTINKIRALFVDLHTEHLTNFHDELLASVLELVLSASTVFVPITTRLTVIVLAIKTGVQAASAVSTLHRLVLEFSAERESSLVEKLYFNHHLSQLLPLLDPYLMISEDTGATRGKIKLVAKTAKTTRKKSLRDSAAAVWESKRSHTEGDAGTPLPPPPYPVCLNINPLLTWTNPHTLVYRPSCLYCHGCGGTDYLKCRPVVGCSIVLRNQHYHGASSYAIVGAIGWP